MERLENMEFLVASANHQDIYYDPIGSHAATHFEDTPQLKSLAQEILAKTVVVDKAMLFDTDMGRIVGQTDLVENQAGDIITYAKRKNRDNYTAFNKTQAPKPCALVTVYVIEREDGKHELATAWIGSAYSPPFPGGEHETPESKPYWTKHSLAWGTQEIQEDTETTVCPW